MKTALIFGSSGLIGSYLLDLIVNDNNYSKIRLFVRSEPVNTSSKIEIIKTDFNNLENHKDSIAGDVCFFCIGTTRKKTPDKNEYINIEYNLPIEVAKIAKSNSVNNFIYVSSIGANTNASGLYLKNKGQAEEELKKFNGVVEIVSEIELMDWKAKIDRLGISICPNSSVAVSGSMKLRDNDIIKSHENIVVILTAHGSKFSNIATEYHNNPSNQHANIPSIIKPDIIDLESILEL